jgi:hypothetical protein
LTRDIGLLRTGGQSNRMNAVTTNPKRQLTAIDFLSRQSSTGNFCRAVCHDNLKIHARVLASLGIEGHWPAKLAT